MKRYAIKMSLMEANRQNMNNLFFNGYLVEWTKIIMVINLGWCYILHFRQLQVTAHDCKINVLLKGLMHTWNGSTGASEHNIHTSQWGPKYNTDNLGVFQLKSENKHILGNKQCFRTFKFI